MRLFVGKVDQPTRQRIHRLWLKAWHAEGAKFDPSFLNDRNSASSEGVTDFAIHSPCGEVAAGARITKYESFVHNSETELFSRELKDATTPLYFLNACFVDKSHRGQGFAKILDRERILAAAKLGAERIYLIAVGDKRRECFEQLGCLVIEKNSSYESMSLGGAPLYLMTRDLVDLNAEHILNYGPKISRSVSIDPPKTGKPASTLKHQEVYA
jgi:GNAT superfamily N-acetyltransferase